MSERTTTDHESNRLVTVREDGTPVIIITPPDGHGLVWGGSSRLDRRGK